VLVAWAGMRRGDRKQRRIRPYDITAVVPDISVEDNQKLAQAAMQLGQRSQHGGAAGRERAGLSQDGAAHVRQVRGEQIGEHEIMQMLEGAGGTGPQNNGPRTGARRSEQGAGAVSTKRKDHAPTPDCTVMQASDPQPVDPSSLWAGLDRSELRKQFAGGDLPELEFEAVVFRAVYPNWNFVRFRPEEMDAFAGSFVGAPFLRNHDMGDIGARDGLVLDAWMAGDAMHARIKLTTMEGIRDFLGAHRPLLHLLVPDGRDAVQRVRQELVRL